MQPRAIFAQGELSDEVQAYAASCASLVDAAKTTLGIQSMTQEFDIPGGGTVRVESLMNTTRVIVSTEDAEGVVLRDERREDEEGEPTVSRLVWLPEGFVITPRTKDAPKGFGLNDAGAYVPGGKITHVIINRDPDNYYPDAQIARLKGGAMEVEPVFFTKESEESGRRIGIEDGEGFLPQLTENRLELAPEFKAHDGWYCHRPELVPYVESDEEADAEAVYRSTLLKWILIYTNQVREQLNKKKCLPPLRGLYSVFAESTLHEMQRARTQAHNSLRYREGYQKYTDRMSRCAAFDSTGNGENLATGNIPRNTGESDTDYAKRQALIYVQSWVDSPPHFANMVLDRTSDHNHEFLELSSGQGTVRYRQLPPYTEDNFDEHDIDPPFTGTMAVQLFRGRDRLVDHGLANWHGELGVVSWFPGHSPTGASLLIDLRDRIVPQTGHVVVYTKGRAISLTRATKEIVEEEGVEKVVATYPYVCGAGMFASEQEGEQEGDVAVAALVARLPNDLEKPATLEMYQCEIGGESKLVATMELDLDAVEISKAIFSPDGKKCVVRVSTLVDHPNNYLMFNERDFNKEATIDYPGYGTKLEFIEFKLKEDEEDEEEEKWEHEVVHTSQVDIEIEARTDGGSPGYRTNYFIQDVDEEFNWMASYSDDGELVYAKVHIDIHTEQEEKWFDDGGATTTGSWEWGFDGSVDLSYFGEIIFPNGSKLTYMNVSGSFEAATGHFLKLAYLDINKPDDVVYARCDISPKAHEPGMAHKKHDSKVRFAGEDLMEFKECGQDFNEAYDRACLTGSDIAEQSVFYEFLNNVNVPQWRTVHPIGWNGLNARYTADPWRPFQRRGNVCRVTHALRLDGGSDYSSPAATDHSISVAPIAAAVAFPSTELVARDFSYGGERIRVCLWYRGGEKATTTMRGNLFGPVSKGYPRPPQDPPNPDDGGQTVSKVLSSINLKEIIGLDDLDDDFLPMGVI